MTWAVYVLARLVTVACVAVVVVAVVYDARTERITSGRIPAQFASSLQVRLQGDDDDVVGVAHNAGDELTTATRAVAYGVDAVEIDVRMGPGGLFASHDAPLPFLQDLVFRGPSLASAWEVAQLRGTVLLHLKQRSPRYLAAVRDFVRAQPPRRLIVQSHDPSTLRYVGRGLPGTRRLLLVTASADLQRLRADAGLQAEIDGVSVRDSLLGPEDMAWLEQRRLQVYAWVVNDERRINALVRAGVDGIITERLDVMRLLGRGYAEAVEGQAR